MSFKFRNGQTDSITLGTSAVPTTGTFSCWTKCASFGGNFIYYFFVQQGSNLFHQEYYGGLVNLYSGWYNGTDARIVAGVPTDAVWNHVLMTWSPSSSKLYLNGAQVGSTVTTDGTFDSTGATRYIGASNASFTQTVDHYIAEMGIWSDIESGSNIADLAAGKYPNCFSTNLVNYWPLSSDATDGVGGDNGSASGAAVDATHPTMVACGGGGGSTVPPLMDYCYRRRI